MKLTEYDMRFIKRVSQSDRDANDGKFYVQELPMGEGYIVRVNDGQGCADYYPKQKVDYLQGFEGFQWTNVIDFEGMVSQGYFRYSSGSPVKYYEMTQKGLQVAGTLSGW